MDCKQEVFPAFMGSLVEFQSLQFLDVFFSPEASQFEDIIRGWGEDEIMRLRLNELDRRTENSFGWSEMAGNIGFVDLHCRFHPVVYDGSIDKKG